MKDFIFLLTGEPNNDTAVKNYVGFEDTVCIFKMKYILPYHNFNELKSFQLTARYKPFKTRIEYAAVDISEWIKHENEEYFDIAMKFFHDYIDLKYIFTVGSCTQEEIKALYKKASQYMQGDIVSLIKNKKKRSLNNARS